MKELTPRQREVLEFISNTVAERSYPPSVREICAGVGIRSTATVHAYLKDLAEMGYLTKDDRKTRALSVNNEGFKRVPLLGKVTAGQPITAVENIEGYVPFEAPTSGDNYFALNVQGDSMINAGIYNGDVIIVHCQEDAQNGDIVVALLDDEATVKRLKLEDGGKTLTLMPENPNYAPIPANNCTILGKVCALIRKY
ncbi:MAG: transcriptional repressor LexA [Clostridia bacterium]|nr:transcriptional repressor LexA [Clostridia bacterium]